MDAKLALKAKLEAAKIADTCQFMATKFADDALNGRGLLSPGDVHDIVVLAFLTGAAVASEELKIALRTKA
jgi:hypothetical protein